MISVDEARAHIASFVDPLDPVDVPIGDAVGCVVAADVVATEPIPSFTNSSMDGYALNSADTSMDGVTLRVADVILAGRLPQRHLQTGEAMRIMTGAPLPPGADCVEMIEEVTVDDADSTVTIRRRIAPGTFVRQSGDDISVGTTLVRAGSELTASQVGVLASQGLGEIRVVPRPRVGVLSTGNEVTSAPGQLPAGAIRDVNRPLLLSLLRELDVTPVDLGAVADQLDGTREAIARAVASCDAVITTGGVSVGDADFVKVAISDLGGESARSMHVAVRPGKPLAFGCVGENRVPVFGLPGNPVSTRVSFELFVRPSLRRRGGHRVTERMTVSAVIDVPMARDPDGKVHMVHVRVYLGHDGRVHVVETMREGSHLLHAVASANAIAAVPDGEGLATGDEVRVIVLRPHELGPA